MLETDEAMATNLSQVSFSIALHPESRQNCLKRPKSTDQQEQTWLGLRKKWGRLRCVPVAQFLKDI
jgi:hypothetical protein